MVAARIRETMVEAFSRGDTIDAQNLSVFLSSLETMSDAAFDALADEEIEGAIS